MFQQELKGRQEEQAMAIQMAVERALATKMEELTWELEKLTEIGELVRVKTQSREPNRIQHRPLMSPEEITKALTDDIAKHASLLPFFCKKPASLESDMYVGSSPQLYFKKPPPQITKQIAETLLPTFSFTRHPNRMRGSITYIHTYIHT